MWQRIPLIVRAVLSGLVVYMLVGFFLWMAIVALIPAPWSLVIMSLVLVVYWQVFSGRWGPQRSADLRRERFRAVKLPRKLWAWSLIAALVVVLFLQSALVVTFRLIPFPAESFALGFEAGDKPSWLVWLYILLMAAVAGITEEVGFRGYMQVPLEKRYSAWVAILVSGLMFMVLHLNQAWAPYLLLHLFVIGVAWGLLAYVSGSLIPGMVSHVLADIFNFSYWWTDVAGHFERQPIAVSGLDAHFVVWLLVLIVALLGSIWVLRKTNEVRPFDLKSRYQKNIME